MWFWKSTYCKATKSTDSSLMPLPGEWQRPHPDVLFSLWGPRCCLHSVVPFKTGERSNKVSTSVGVWNVSCYEQRFNMLLSGDEEIVFCLLVSGVSAMKSKDLSAIMQRNHVNKSAQQLSRLLCQPLPPHNNHYWLTITKTIINS